MNNAYAVSPQPHIGKSDHLPILPQPTYIKKQEANSVTIRTVKMRTESALAELQGCLEETDINIFKEATNNNDCTVSSSIDWCSCIYIPSQFIRVFPDQKRWLLYIYAQRSENGKLLTSQGTS